MASGPLFGVLAMRALDCARPADHRAGAGAPRPIGRKRWALVANAVFVAIVLLLATAAAAGAQWSAPFDISGPTGIAEGPQVAIDHSGTATVVWTRYEGSEVTVQARRIDAGGSLGPIVDVSEGGESLNAQLAVDPAGNATVVWTAHDGPDTVAKARRITAAGALEAVRTLSAPGDTGFSPVVAADADGDVTAVWTRYENPHFRLQARRIDPTGALTPIEDLTPDSLSNLHYDLASGPAGNAFAVWRWDATGESVIQGRPIAAGGRVGPIVYLSAAGQSAFDAHVTVDPAGAATAVWYRADGVVQARRITPNGVLGQIVDLSHTDSHAPDVAVDQRGDATVVWTRYDGATDRTELRRLAPDGALGAVRDLWTGGDDVGPRVAVDDAGDATVLWLHTESGSSSVRSRTAASSGVLGASIDLIPVTDDEIESPELATDPSGSATAVWTRVGGGSAVIAGARFPGSQQSSPPTAPAGSAPSRSVRRAGPASCPVVVLKKLTTGRPRPGRSRVKGVAAKLRLSSAARVELVFARLTYRRDGRRRRATLPAGQPSGSGRTATLRLRLPPRLARSLPLGRPATLRLRLRARSAVAGCAFGPVKTRNLRTRIAWIGVRPTARTPALVPGVAVRARRARAA